MTDDRDLTPFETAVIRHLSEQGADLEATFAFVGAHDRDRYGPHMVAHEEGIFPDHRDEYAVGMTADVISRWTADATDDEREWLTERMHSGVAAQIEEAL